MVQALDATPRRDLGRVPPHNLEAEESLLGAMLLSRDAISAATEVGVDTTDFYKPAHANIYDAIMSLYGQGEPVDPVTVADELRRADLLDGLGGRQALLRLQAQTPASANASHYARIVNELALLRKLIAVAGEISEMGYDDSGEVAETLDRAEALVFEVAERRVSDSMTGVSDALQDTLDQLEALYGSDGEITGVETGYVDLDSMLLGLQPSNLLVVAARPGAGKTAFALGAAANVAMSARRPVMFFSMEMGTVELTKRLLAGESRVELRKLQTGKIREDEWTRLSHAVGRLAETPLLIDDNPHCTVMEMRAKARRTKARYGDLGLIVVDYLQLMSPSTTRRTENRQVEVAEISRGLKILARELDCPVMALSQLNRQLEYRQDKRPMLADLRESGCVTADTRVLRADTNLEVSIGELLLTNETNIPIWTVDQHLNLVRGTITSVFPTGVKKVFELRLASGRSVKASANHPFLTVEGWARLDELHIGSRVAVPRRLPDPSVADGWRDAVTEPLNDTVPGDVWDYIVNKHMPNLDEDSRALVEHLGLKPYYVRMKMIGRDIRRSRMQQLADYFSDELLADFANSDIFWDRVVAIEPLGEQPVFDVTVPETHNFIGDGIVLENSLEQDADVVIFLYRDEIYNPESDQRGTAEFIVAKHRNGPTGVTRVAFLDHFTKFANMARDT